MLTHKIIRNIYGNLLLDFTILGTNFFWKNWLRYIKHIAQSFIIGKNGEYFSMDDTILIMS